MASIETGELTFVDGTASGTRSTQLVALTNGNTLMVWVGGTSAGGTEAFGKVIDAAGNQVGATFQLSQSAGAFVVGFDTAKIDDGHIAIVFNATQAGGGSAPIRAAVFDPVAMANGGSIPSSFLVATPSANNSRAAVEVVDGDLAFLWQASSGMGTGNSYGTVLDAQTHAVVTAEQTLYGIGSSFGDNVVSLGNTLAITGKDSSGAFVVVLDKDFQGAEGGGRVTNVDNTVTYGYGSAEGFQGGVIASFNARSTLFGSYTYSLQVVGEKMTGSWNPPTGTETSVTPYVVGDRIVAVYGQKAQVLSYTSEIRDGIREYHFTEQGPEFYIESSTIPDDIVAHGNGFLAVWHEGVGDRDIVGQFFTTLGTEKGLLTSGDYGGELDAGGTQSLSGNVLTNDLPETGSGKAVTAVNGTAVGTGATAIVGTYGTLTIASDGSYSYKADRPAAIALTENQSVQESFTYRARTSDGDDDTDQISFNVNGVFDGGARNVALTSNTVTENGGPGSEVGELTFEAEESFTYELVDNAGKPFAIDSDGRITTTAALDREAKASYTLTVKLTGERSGQATTKDFVINVADVNEAPSKPTLAATSALTNDHGTYRATGGTTGKLGTLTSIDPEGGSVRYTLNAQLYNPSTGNYTASDAFEIVGGELRATKPLPAGYYFLSINSKDAGSNPSTFLDFGLSVQAPPAPPVISSNGGGATAIVTVDENGKAVTTVSASRFPGYTIVGGADAAKFDIDYGTGALTFKAAANFEAPTDADKDNTYEVKVRATSNGLFDEQTISVKVGDVNEFAPVIAGAASVSVGAVENAKTVTTVRATDSDKSAVVTYALTGGADRAAFNLDARTGVLTFKSAPNFEAPKDAGKNNVYDVIVTASDGAKTDTQAIAVKVGDVNEFAPVIAGAASASISVPENGKAVTTIQATDSDKAAVVTYSLSGGADKAAFNIDAKTGVLTFKTAPDFEAPRDAGRNNVYDVIVKASDGTKFDTQTLAVKVTDVGGPAKGAPVAHGDTFVFTKGAAATAPAIDPGGADAGELLRLLNDFFGIKDHGSDAAIRVVEHGGDDAGAILHALHAAKIGAGDLVP